MSGNEQTRNIRCCENHANESCPISMIINIMNRQKQTTLTCYPSGPTLLRIVKLKLWGKDKLTRNAPRSEI